MNEHHEHAERVRPRKRGGGHAPGPDGAPLCGAHPPAPRFSEPPTCSQCLSVQSTLAGRVKKKKNRVKGKHAKGPEGHPLCGVESKGAYFSASPSCVQCVAALALAAMDSEVPTPPSRAEKRSGKAKKGARKAAKAEAMVVAACPLCGVPIPEHRMERHKRKVHSGEGRRRSSE